MRELSWYGCYDGSLKKVIVDEAPFFRHKYESLTMREYFDFSIIETGILKRRYLDG